MNLDTLKFLFIYYLYLMKTMLKCQIELKAGPQIYYDF